MGSRRNEIINLARVLFADQGYSVTSMRDLAEAAGIQAGSLYAHFGSKAEIVGEIMTHFFGELVPRQQAVYDGPGTGAARFAEMIAVVYDVCEANAHDIQIMHHEWKTLIRIDELQPLLGPSDTALDLWRDVIRDGIEDGSIKPSLDPEYVVRAVTHAIFGLFDSGRYEHRNAPREGLSAVEFLQVLFLSGTATRSPALVRRITREAKANAL